MKLTFVSDVCIESNDFDILDLYRSTRTVPLETEAGTFEVQAFLCQHKSGGEPLIHVAFSSRDLKRRPVYRLESETASPTPEAGLELLAKLGFRMDQVNLNLSSAMRSVVLRDIPVLRPPGELRKILAEREGLIEELERTSRLEPGDESMLGDTSLPILERLKLKQAIESRRAAAKTASQRLVSEHRQGEQAEALRKALEARFAPSAAPPPAPPAHRSGQEPPRKEKPQAAAPAKEATREKKKTAKASASRPEPDVPPPAPRQPSSAAPEAPASPPPPSIPDRRDEGLRVAALEGELEQTHRSAEAERQTRLKLEKELAGARSRVAELEATLERAEEKDRAAAKRRERETAEASQQNERLSAELAKVQDESRTERETRKQAEKDLARAQGRIVALEKELAGHKAELEKARSEAVSGNRLGQELKEAKARSARLEKELAAARSRSATSPPTAGKTAVSPAAAQAQDESAPHVVRRPPPPGAFFHVDWDLQTLPCSSVDQVEEAWQSTYNVQLSLEGYPNQYCAAFVVILREKDRKSLFLVFRLAVEKRCLVYRPAKPPTDMPSLTRAVEEAQRFVKMSGIELEKIPPAQRASGLKSILPG